MVSNSTGMHVGGRRTPWHLWLVGALGLLWNAYGGFDYFMSKTRGDAYLQSVGMTPEQIAHLNAMPPWMTAVWAIGVWGALLGAVLLLARAQPRLCVPDRADARQHAGADGLPARDPRRLRVLRVVRDARAQPGLAALAPPGRPCRGQGVRPAAAPPFASSIQSIARVLRYE